MPWPKGRPHSPETIAMIRATSNQPEARAAMSKLKLGGGRIPEGKESLYRLAIRKRFRMAEALELCGASQ